MLHAVALAEIGLAHSIDQGSTVLLLRPYHPTDASRLGIEMAGGLHRSRGCNCRSLLSGSGVGQVVGQPGMILEVSWIQIEEEAARSLIVELTVGHTALSVGEDTLLLGSSDSDVEESPLLLDVLLLTVSVTGDQLILEPHAVDLLVLQSLGGMHSHQSDTGRAVLLLIRIGEERHIADKVLDGHRIVR